MKCSELTILQMRSKVKKMFGRYKADLGEEGTMPESLKRVVKLTGREMKFVKCDLTNVSSLDTIFEQVKWVQPLGKI